MVDEGAVDKRYVPEGSMLKGPMDERMAMAREEAAANENPSPREAPVAEDDGTTKPSMERVSTRGPGREREDKGGNHKGDCYRKAHVALLHLTSPLGTARSTPGGLSRRVLSGCPSPSPRREPLVTIDRRVGEPSGISAAPNRPDL